jgi:Bacterial regulatory proteins, tetR family
MPLRFAGVASLFLSAMTRESKSEVAPSRDEALVKSAPFLRQSRRAEDTADTRAALLQAGKQLFDRDGYHATSLDEVVERSRLSKGALYHHFKNKEELFVEVMWEV